jgi:hypothetical protein
MQLNYESVALAWWLPTRRIILQGEAFPEARLNYSMDERVLGILVPSEGAWYCVDLLKGTCLAKHTDPLVGGFCFTPVGGAIVFLQDGRLVELDNIAVPLSQARIVCNLQSAFADFPVVSIREFGEYLVLWNGRTFAIVERSSGRPVNTLTPKRCRDLNARHSAVRLVGGRLIGEWMDQPDWKSNQPHRLQSFDLLSNELVVPDLSDFADRVLLKYSCSGERILAIEQDRGRLTFVDDREALLHKRVECSSATMFSAAISDSGELVGYCCDGLTTFYQHGQEFASLATGEGVTLGIISDVTTTAAFFCQDNRRLQDDPLLQPLPLVAVINYQSSELMGVSRGHLPSATTLLSPSARYLATFYTDDNAISQHLECPAGLLTITDLQPTSEPKFSSPYE